MASRDDSFRGISVINRRALIAIAASVGFGTFAFGQDRSIVVASTTSTEDSGLFGYILPLFKAGTPRYGHISPSDLNRLSAFLVKNKLLKKAVPASQAVTNQFVPKG